MNGEYQERLQEIEDGEEYDRQEIESNDGSYAIAWQDVLAVFASYVSGAEDGAPVAYLDEENLDRLRTTLWNMNEVDHRIEAQSHDVEVPGEEGNTSTETITETVLVIELTHRSPEKMRDEYDFNARQNEYLSLLLAEDIVYRKDGQCLPLRDRIAWLDKDLFYEQPFRKSQGGKKRKPVWVCEECEDGNP